MLIMSWSVMQKKVVCYFQGQGHRTGSYDQNMSFVLYLLNCWSFCYKTLFVSTLSSAGVSYEEIGLLCSGSRSRHNFKMSMTVYPDAVFWNAEPYTSYQTWYGNASPWAKLSSKNIGLLSSRSRSQWSIHVTNNDFIICLLNCWSFRN